MRSHQSCRYAASKGFTLVESIMVLVVLAIAAAGIATLSGNIFNSQADNKTLQVGMQLMQECAEHVLATRRVAGYPTTPPICTSLPDPTALGFSKPFVKSSTETTTGTFGIGTTGCLLGGSCGCPTNGTCTLVTITVSPTGGGEITPLALLLVK